MRFHSQTAGVSLTAQQPLNNIVRTTVEALAGVLGGTQSLHTNSYDEALALPTEDAVRVALRTQRGDRGTRTGVAATADPLGGSYYVEALTTDEMERQSYEYFAKIEELGGMVAAVKSNYPREGRDRRRGLRAAAREIDAGRARRWWASTATCSRTRSRSPPCAWTPPSNASRSTACRPRGRTATERGSSARSRALRDHAAHPDHNLDAACSTAAQRTRQRGGDRGVLFTASLRGLS